MIREKWNQILQNKEVRQNLSCLRKEIKDYRQRRILTELIEGEEDALISLLADEDAKTRKNAALLMGDLSLQKILEPVRLAVER